MKQDVKVEDIQFIQSRAEINMFVVDEYAEAMVADPHAFPSIQVVFDGQRYYCWDGMHRTLAARKAGVARLAANIENGTERDALLCSLRANAFHGLRRTKADKHHAVETALRDLEWSKWSDREIARRCAVSHQFVTGLRASYRSSNVARSIRSERTYITPRGTMATMDTAKIGHSAQITDTSPSERHYVARPGSSILHREDEDAAPSTVQSAMPVLVAHAPAPSSPLGELAVHFSSQSPEHYTPQLIIDATLACLAQIDLDPCSNSHEQPSVPATRHFTVEDDGLQREWHGRIYMNPPYGQEIDRWIEKLCAEHNAGRTVHAITLVPSRTDTQWWRRLRDFPACFIEGRLTFIGNDNPAPFPSAVFYLGEDIGGFYRAFCHLGDCWQRMEPGVSFGE